MNMNPQVNIISQVQKESLVQFLEKNDFLVNPRKKAKFSAEACNKAWRELMLLLNSKPGPKKTVFQWKETLNELKARAANRAKVIEIQNSGPNPRQTEKDLTPLEHKLLLVTSDKFYRSII